MKKETLRSSTLVLNSHETNKECSKFCGEIFTGKTEGKQAKLVCAFYSSRLDLRLRDFYVCVGRRREDNRFAQK